MERWLVHRQISPYCSNRCCQLKCLCPCYFSTWLFEILRLTRNSSNTQAIPFQTILIMRFGARMLKSHSSLSTNSCTELRVGDTRAGRKSISNLCFGFHIQDLQELQATCPQRCWGRRHMENLWTSGHVVRSLSVSVSTLRPLLTLVLSHRHLLCWCVAQVWSCTSSWLDTLRSGMRTSTSSTSRSKREPMMWGLLSVGYVTKEMKCLLH